jgi:hypothetical protein
VFLSGAGAFIRLSKISQLGYNTEPMQIVGRIESVWRYPAKRMRGEELQHSDVAFAGMYGDRLYAFRSSGARKGISLSD